MRCKSPVEKLLIDFRPKHKFEKQIRDIFFLYIYFFLIKRGDLSFWKKKNLDLQITFSFSNQIAPYNQAKNDKFH